ncbi:hypothetical protein HBI38_178500 [Parastagonospora nodorum]|nr:hypothetical protein HBI09_081260 [Parastagonospora nodorum]KAH4183313.1 hypothetical protein HBH42_207630 [Parastagonospora nodorum]KAH4218141.1 hypothetical protein HBI06_206920 [Parastagonospora nodorum]KAH4242989.1 hypothetical protein HBI05_091980 [Parastagonospora nodorum]KAH4988288.1 hypothetical protein HBI76_088620 [Parastagonospora nodorum]
MSRLGKRIRVGRWKSPRAICSYIDQTNSPHAPFNPSSLTYQRERLVTEPNVDYGSTNLRKATAHATGVVVRQFASDSSSKQRPLQYRPLEICIGSSVLKKANRSLSWISFSPAHHI